MFAARPSQTGPRVPKKHRGEPTSAGTTTERLPNSTAKASKAVLLPYVLIPLPSTGAGNYGWLDSGIEGRERRTAVPKLYQNCTKTLQEFTPWAARYHHLRQERNSALVELTACDRGACGSHAHAGELVRAARNVSTGLKRNRFRRFGGSQSDEKVAFGQRRRYPAQVT